MMILPIVLILASPPPAEPVHFTGTQPVSATLSSDHTTYYAGELVRLTLTTRNHSQERLIGLFAVIPGRTELRYRRSGNEFEAFKAGAGKVGKAHPEPAESSDVFHAPFVLDPGAEWKGETGRLVLDEPDEYEFVVISHPAKDASQAITSNILVIHIAPVPDDEKDAFSVYRAQDLMRIARSAGYVVDTDRSKVMDAVSFIRRFPKSIYATQLRIELSRALRPRVEQGRATNELRDAFRQLGVLTEQSPPSQ